MIEPDDPRPPLAPDPFPEPVCATCRYPIGRSAYGVLCDECGSEWLYGREDERVLTFAEVCGWAAHGEVLDIERRWRIG